MANRFNTIIIVGLVIIGGLIMRGAPDWYTYRLESERHVLGDLGELAVRLGSPVSHDRRGSVIWMYTGDQGQGFWDDTLAGTGADALITSENPIYGSYTLRLVAGSDGAKGAQLFKNFAAPRRNVWGFAINFAVITNYDVVSISINHYDGAKQHQARVRIYDADKTIRYRDAANVNQVIDTLTDLSEVYGTFHWLKLVADFENDEYVRVMFDDQEYDLADIPIYTAASAELAHVRVYVSIFGLDGENDVMILDSAVFTIDEP